MDKVKGILGIDVGDFDLRLDKPSYRLGDTIRGTFQFTLKKPRSGSRVWAAVKAVRTVKTREKTAEGRTQTHTDEEEIFKDERHLDGQREYSDGRYAFEFLLPEHVEGYNLYGVDAALDRLDDKYRGLAAGAWSLLQSKVAPDAPRSDQIIWTVSAGLNFPWSVSPKKAVRINVGRNKDTPPAVEPGKPWWDKPGAVSEQPVLPPPPPPAPAAYAPPAPAPAPSPARAVVCGQCGTAPPRPQAKFCTTCGASLQTAPAPRMCGCGERLEPDDKFCTCCGARQG